MKKPSLTQDFFALKETRESIHELAHAKKLVLVLGSGLSASQGLPAWNQLLRRLLDHAAAQHDGLSSDDEQRAFVETLLRTTDPTILGSIVRGLFRGDETFYDALKQAIYPRAFRTSNRRPASNFCRTVWELIFTRFESELETLVVTTNYDDVLETAFDTDLDLRSLAQSLGIHYPLPIHNEHYPDEIDTAVPIFHIHGYVPLEGNERVDPGAIILSARDYGQKWEDHWSFELLSQHWDAQWLFVGMSFHDPHITYFMAERGKYVRRESTGTRAGSRNGPSPIGVFSLQGQPWANLAGETKRALWRAEVSRLRELDMRAMATTFFFEDAQFLHEIALQTRLGEKCVPYIDRRRQWSEAFVETRLSRPSAVSSTEIGRVLHEVLGRIREGIEEVAHDEDELFKAELWCCDITERSLFLIGSSEYLPGDAERTHRYPFSTALPIAAIKAFTNGSSVNTDARISPASRWKHYLAVPITLGGEPWLDLPVGALVIGSSSPRLSSTLATESATLEARLEHWINLLTPLINPEREYKGALHVSE